MPHGEQILMGWPSVSRTRNQLVDAQAADRGEYGGLSDQKRRTERCLRAPRPLPSRQFLVDACSTACVELVNGFRQSLWVDAHLFGQVFNSIGL